MANEQQQQTQELPFEQKAFNNLTNKIGVLQGRVAILETENAELRRQLQEQQAQTSDGES